MRKWHTMGKIVYHLTESQEKQGKFHGKKGIYAPRKVRQLANYFFKSSEQIKWSIKRKERKKESYNVQHETAQNI